MISFNERILKSEHLLAGPQSISLDERFWGFKYFGLRKSIIPKAAGHIEELNIYCNLDDVEQDLFIVRHSEWDAGADQKIYKDLTPQSTLNVDMSYYICPSTTGLLHIIEPLEVIDVRLSISQIKTLNPIAYQIFHHRSNQTVLNFSWLIDDPIFKNVTNYFDYSWKSILNCCNDVTCKEIDETWK